MIGKVTLNQTTATAAPMVLRRQLSVGAQFLIALAILTLAASVELAMGRIPISKSGRIMFWVGDPQSPELSQQLADWYSFSHVLHGFIFYGVIHLLSRRRWSAGFCLLLAIFIEACWEILENTPFTIERYRQATASQGYVGDSILNSMSDILCCTFGYLIARKIPVWLTLSLIVIVEVGLLLAIRDNLTLNIVMLIHPIDAIKQWQIGK